MRTLAAKLRPYTVVAAVALVGIVARAESSLPSTTVVALDSHEVQLPRDLSTVNVLIVGFSRASAEATTAWEIPVRTRLADSKVGFYDVAVLASVPSFFRGWINRSLKKKVPQVLQPRFLPVYTDEAAWKSYCGYDEHAPDAAYVVLTDRAGKVLWQTHEPYGYAIFAGLKAKTAAS